jgi:phosphoribosylanthranilate isomerase
MWVKICGITNIEDAIDAIEAGADSLGFILSTDSPRKIGFDKVSEIINQVNKISSRGACNNNFKENNKTTTSFTGVFVNESFGFIKKFLNSGLLDTVQLSGEEGPEPIRKIKGHFPEVKIIKVIRIKKDSSAEDVRSLISGYMKGRSGGFIDYFLLDTFNLNEHGGTGNTFDWNGVKEIGKHHPVILAGGLTALNVTGAIRKICPQGVDCSTGVEIFKGKKDKTKMTEFVKNAKGT